MIKMQKDKELNTVKPNELKVFIKENSYFIYEYINSQVLNNIAIMNPEYFINIIKEIFYKKVDLNINQNIFPYFIFTLIGNKGKLDYTSFRKGTIDLSQINTESTTYYNYVKFSLNSDKFIIELMQNKIGGMPIKEDILKFKKELLLNKISLQEFIFNQNKNFLSSNKNLKKIKDAVDIILE